MATEAQHSELVRDTDRPEKKSDRNTSEIERDLAAARARLAHSVEQLIDQVHPTRIKQRQVAGLKDWASSELAQAKSLFVDDHGRVRTRRLAVIGGAITGVVTFVVVVRAIVDRNR